MVHGKSKRSFIDVSLDTENKKVEMTFRSEEFIKRFSKATISVNPRQKVDGIVKKIESYGLFIQIDGSKLQGLCHKSEVSRSIFSIMSMLTGFASFPTIRMQMQRQLCRDSGKEIA